MATRTFESSLSASLLAASLLLFVSSAEADDAPRTAFTGRLYLGAAHFEVDSESEPRQRGPVLSAQADLGFRLTSLVGLHAVLLYDGSSWTRSDEHTDDMQGGGFGTGAGVDLHFASFLASAAAGWQSTQFYTDWDGDSESAKSWFISTRLGYVLSLPRGWGAGGHLFARYFRARDDEQNGVRHDPVGYELGALLSIGFEGGRPLLDLLR